MPLVDESAYWTTPDSPQDVVSFLEANAPAWIPNEGSGVLGGPAGIISYGVIDHAVGPGWDRDQLVFTVAVTGDGSTGIRADAEVIPPNAMCVTAAG